MKISIEDTGDPTATWDATWLVRIDKRRVSVDVQRLDGWFAARTSGTSGMTFDGNTVRDAVANAISPRVDAEDQESSTAKIRKAIRDLARCLEIRKAMRGARLPKMPKVKP